MIATFDIVVLLGPLLAACGIGVSVYLWRRSRARKAVSYRLTTQAVVSVRRDVGARVKITYDDHVVTDVRLLVLHVANTGNAEITAADFAEPLTVVLGADAEVLTPPAVAETVPPELAPEARVEGKAVVIAPLLLNAGDSFNVTTLVSSLGASNHLRARIRGVSTLTDMGDAGVPRRGWRARLRPFGLFTMTTLATAAYVLPVGWFVVFGGLGQDHAKVVLTSGPSLCGDVLRTDARTVVLKLAGSGALRSLPFTEVKAIKDKAC